MDNKSNTIRLTLAQAIVKFLDKQYVSFDGNETKFVEGFFTLFGHGTAVGLGEALDTQPGGLKVFQGRNEQGMCHVATAFAKQNNRRRIIACASSIGPGAANMVTACATASVNNIPLLVFPADSFGSRQPDPVLQQLEQSYDPTVTTNDAFKPVCKYWDRITRPEQIMSSLINAMRVLTDPSETGAVCISICQDVEGEAYNYPEYFFQKRVHRIVRIEPSLDELEDVKEAILQAKKPFIICGGGVRYSEAGKELEAFSENFNIPFGETQAGKSACKSSHPYCMSGVGVCGSLAANSLAKDADLIIAIGTRLSDFTTGSKRQFQNPDVKMVSINTSRYHAYKMDAKFVVADAKIAIKRLNEMLVKEKYQSAYKEEVKEAKKEWQDEVRRLKGLEYNEHFEPIIQAKNEKTIPEFIELTSGVITQTAAILNIREIIDEDAVIVTAGGSLPSCLQRIWSTDKRYSYHAEYGYSCMGYEVAALLGCKLASATQEVYAFVGDASFQMLHSEIMTAQQEKQKINVLLFDNCGFGCINNLQMNHGVSSLATEFRYRDEHNTLQGDLIPVNYAMLGEAYGLVSYRVTTIEELRAALLESKKQTRSTLIEIKVLPKTMTDGYASWWNVGIATESSKAGVREAWKKVKEGREEARQY